MCGPQASAGIGQIFSQQYGGFGGFGRPQQYGGFGNMQFGRSNMQPRYQPPLTPSENLMAGSSQPLNAQAIMDASNANPGAAAQWQPNSLTPQQDEQRTAFNRHMQGPLSATGAGQQPLGSPQPSAVNQANLAAANNAATPVQGAQPKISIGSPNGLFGAPSGLFGG